MAVADADVVAALVAVVLAVAARVVRDGPPPPLVFFKVCKARKRWFWRARHLRESPASCVEST